MEACIVLVECGFIPSELGSYAVKDAFRGGQLLALARCPAAARFLETALGVLQPTRARVLCVLAVVRELFAFVGRHFTDVREVISLIGFGVAAIGGRTGIASRRRVGRNRPLGGTERVIGA